MKPFSIECLEPDSGPPSPVEVRLVGFLDAHTVVSFEKTMAELQERQYTKFIILISGLTYISSAGIGVLMVLLQQLHRRQGNMVIVQPTEKVHKILDLLGFTKIFQIMDDIDTARQALD